jgi:hypothetical protein
MRHYSAAAVTQGDSPVRILVHQCLVQPASDGQPTLGNGDWCLGHLAFGVLGTGVRGSCVGGQTQVS